jgi:hypothetical protein
MSRGNSLNSGRQWMDAILRASPALLSNVHDMDGITDGMQDGPTFRLTFNDGRRIARLWDFSLTRNRRFYRGEGGMLR